MGDVLIHSLLPRTMKRLCARATNHKQSLIINSLCSFGVPGGIKQLASACDSTTAEVKNRRVNRCCACTIIYLTIKGKLDYRQPSFQQQTDKYHVDMRT